MDVKEIKEKLGLDVREIHSMKRNSKLLPNQFFPSSTFEINLRSDENDNHIVKIGDNWYHIFISEWGSIARISQEEAQKFIGEQPKIPDSLQDGDACPRCGGRLYDGVAAGLIVCLDCRFEQPLNDAQKGDESQ